MKANLRVFFQSAQDKCKVVAELNNSLILQYVLPYSFSIRNLTFRAIRSNFNDNDNDNDGDDNKNINNTNVTRDSNGNDYGDNSNCSNSNNKSVQVFRD